MSELNASNLRKEHGNESPDLVGVTELTSPYFMVPPSGTTAQRPQNPEPGTLRFNTDIGTLEVFRAKAIGWEQIQRRDNQYLGGGTGSNAGTGTRGLYMGGSDSNAIDFLTISTFGNTQDFGDLTRVQNQGSSFSSRTRGFLAGGNTPSSPYGSVDTDMVFFSTTGNATDFASLASIKKEAGAFSNSIRGCHNGGGANVIQYITMETGGNFVDFGDTSVAYEQNMGLSSTTRGFTCGGNKVPAYSAANEIEFVNIMTTGNSIDFGDLTVSGYGGSSGSNATRGLLYNRYVSPAVNNTIEYFTMATTGNAIDFGDATTGAYGKTGGMASATRFVTAGGHNGSSNFANIDSVEIATTGNGVDFGDLSRGASNMGGQCSNGHGGL